MLFIHVRGLTARSVGLSWLRIVAMPSPQTSAQARTRPDLVRLSRSQTFAPGERVVSRPERHAPVRCGEHEASVDAIVARNPRRENEGDTDIDTVAECVAEPLVVHGKAIERRAAREGAEILRCDETGAAADHLPRRGYSRRGTPATIDVPDSHIRMNTTAAISNEGPVHFMTHPRAMDSALFITFLSRLLGEVEGKVFLILDRLPAHTSAATRDIKAST